MIFHLSLALLSQQRSQPHIRAKAQTGCNPNELHQIIDASSDEKALERVRFFHWRRSVPVKPGA
jgi:hypothetical protein